MSYSKTSLDVKTLLTASGLLDINMKSNPVPSLGLPPQSPIIMAPVVRPGCPVVCPVDPMALAISVAAREKCPPYRFRVCEAGVDTDMFVSITTLEAVPDGTFNFCGSGPSGPVKGCISIQLVDGNYGWITAGA